MVYISILLQLFFFLKIVIANKYYYVKIYWRPTTNYEECFAINEGVALRLLPRQISSLIMLEDWDELRHIKSVTITSNGQPRGSEVERKYYRKLYPEDEKYLDNWNDDIAAWRADRSLIFEQLEMIPKPEHTDRRHDNRFMLKVAPSESPKPDREIVWVRRFDFAGIADRIESILKDTKLLLSVNIFLLNHEDPHEGVRIVPIFSELKAKL